MLIGSALLILALGLQAQAPAGAAGALGQAYFLFLEGRSLEDDGDLATAAQRYRDALELAPEAAGVRAELAAIYAQQGDLRGARAEAERALEGEPANRSAHRLLGLLDTASLDRTGGPDPANPVVLSAIEHLERASEGGVRDPGIVLALGELYQRAGRPERAIVLLQALLIDRPGHPQATMLLVQAYRAAGQPDMADQLIESVRARAGDSPAARLRNIEDLESRGEWSQAAAAWAQLVEAQPAQVAFRLRHAAALVNSGDVEAARNSLLATVEAEPRDVRAWYLLAQVEARAGRGEAAEAAARRISEIDPADGRGPIALAMVLSSRGDHRGVIGVLQPRVTTPSEADLGSGMFSQMATMLSDAQVELGEVRQGIRTLEDARRRAPADHDVLFNLAATYERHDDENRAEEIFREIITADPRHAPALNYLGYMLADRGRKLPEALTLIERAIAVGGETPAYLDSLGWAYYRLERYDEAIGPLERAASAAPAASVIQDHLGDAYVKLGRHEQAAEAFERALVGDRDGIDEREIASKRDRARRAAPAR